MPLQDVAPLEATTEIAAPPAAVWALVSDVRNMARWSPQTLRTFVTGGREVRAGARMLNLNRRGLVLWPTRAKVIRFEAEREIAWRVKDNGTIWSYRLEALDGGARTRLTSRREAPDGLKDISVRLTDAVFGGVDSFADELVGDMQRTLERIAADAER